MGGLENANPVFLKVGKPAASTSVSMKLTKAQLLDLAVVALWLSTSNEADSLSASFYIFAMPIQARSTHTDAVIVFNSVRDPDMSPWL